MSDAQKTTRTYNDTAAEDSLRRYLTEIGRYPLLTRAEEVQLAKRVEAGDPVARQRLIESNLRLVVTIAKTYRSGALDLLDLVQEGTLGLMKAVDRYDWRRGTKFSTYAAWWIRSEVIAALGANAHPIRLPESVRERAGEAERTERTLIARPGEAPHVRRDRVGARSDTCSGRRGSCRRSVRRLAGRARGRGGRPSSRRPSGRPERHRPASGARGRGG